MRMIPLCTSVLVVSMGLSLVARAAVTSVEGFETSEPGNQAPQKGGEDGRWQFCRGELKGEGLARVEEGKGKNRSKALRLGPDGETGLATYAILSIPALDKQEIRFSVRGDGEEPVSTRCFLKTSQKTEILRMGIGRDRITLGDRHQAILSVAPDGQGWLNLVVKLDRAGGTITVGCNDLEKTVTVEPWEASKLLVQIGQTYRKDGSRQGILLDDFSWLSE